jgi:acylphosphatase
VNMKSVKLVASIHGKVQGVGYRAYAANAASLLSLEGMVQNLPDGRVQLIAEGNEADLRSLLEELRIGPTLAEVDTVEPKWEPFDGEFIGKGFAIIY